MKTRRFLPVILALLAAAFLAAPARAIDPVHAQKADAAIKKGLDYLRTHQAADGSWSKDPGPAVTAMVLSVMLDQPGANPADPAIDKALKFVLSNVKPDGSIQDGALENYNTALALSAISRLKSRPDLVPIIKKAQDYLRQLQWNGQKDPAGKTIDSSSRWFGGAGYGEEGRPDMSNTAVMLEALHDSGVDAKDPAFQRALAFLTRCQGTSANKDFGNQIAPDGGFVYATTKDKTKLSELETKVGTTENEKGDDLDSGAGVYVDAAGQSRLRTYGSMTVSGFKSYIYAQLDRNDVRVTDAYNWIRNNYNLKENPGVGQQGYYYYLHLFARAMKAWGDPILTTPDGQKHDWANEIIDTLVALQKPDGSFVNSVPRWMENDVNLATAHALTALTLCGK